MLSSSRTTIIFALGRVAFGAGLVATPGRAASGWLDEDAKRPPTQVAVRGLGARDVALAGGAILAAREGFGLRPWLVGCVACDLVDVASTLAAGDALSARARWGTVALAGAAAAFGAALAVSAES